MHNDSEDNQAGWVAGKEHSLEVDVDMLDDKTKTDVDVDMLEDKTKTDVDHSTCRTSNYPGTTAPREDQDIETDVQQQHKKEKLLDPPEKAQVKRQEALQNYCLSSSTSNKNNNSKPMADNKAGAGVTGSKEDPIEKAQVKRQNALQPYLSDPALLAAEEHSIEKAQVKRQNALQPYLSDPSLPAIPTVQLDVMPMPMPNSPAAARVEETLLGAFRQRCINYQTSESMFTHYNNNEHANDGVDDVNPGDLEQPRDATTNLGLVEANLVSENQLTILEDMEVARPMSLPVTGESAEQQRQEEKRRKGRLCCLLGLPILLLLVVGLIIFLVGRSSSTSSSFSSSVGMELDSNTTTNNGSVPPPTLPPTTMGEQLFSLLPNSTIDAIINNENSSQALAYQWVLNDPNNYTTTGFYSEERLIQRFAMATFWYSTEGPSSWTNQGGDNVQITLFLPS